MIKKTFKKYSNIVLLLIGIILVQYTLASCGNNKATAAHPSKEYKLLKEKIEKGGTVTPKIEFFHATDRNFEKMHKFIRSRTVPQNSLYHAVFVDDPKYAVFSKYPISAMYFSEEASKHIIAIYTYNTVNGNHGFSYYEKNSWESIAKIRKD